MITCLKSEYFTDILFRENQISRKLTFRWFRINIYTQNYERRRLPIYASRIYYRGANIFVVHDRAKRISEKSGEYGSTRGGER